MEGHRDQRQVVAAYGDESIRDRLVAIVGQGFEQHLGGGLAIAREDAIGTELVDSCLEVGCDELEVSGSVVGDPRRPETLVDLPCRVLQRSRLGFAIGGATRLGRRRHGWRPSRLEAGDALLPEQSLCPGAVRLRLRDIAESVGHPCGRPLRDRVVDGDVGSLDDVECGGDESSGLLGTALFHTNLSEHRTAGDRRLEVLARRFERSGGEHVGLVDATLAQQRSCEQRARLAGVGTDAERAETVPSEDEVGFGGDRVSGDQIDEALEQLGLVEAMAEAEVACRRAGRLELLVGRVESPPQRLQHALAADRGGLDCR